MHTLNTAKLTHAASICTFVIIPKALNFSEINYLLERVMHINQTKAHTFLLYIIALYNICMKFTTKGSVNGSAKGCTTGGLSLLNSYTTLHVHKELYWIPKTYSPPTDRNIWDFRFSWRHIPGDVILLVHQPHIIQFWLNCPE